MTSDARQTGIESKIIIKKNIANSIRREDLNRIKHNYNVGDHILLQKTGLR
jgi:hypothetical protein